MLADVVVYLLSVVHGGSFFGGPSRDVALRHGLVPFELTGGGRHAQTIFESIFLHGSFPHLLCDCYFLVIFAPSIEDATGHLRFLALYLLGALAALALAVLFAPNATVPLLGSSGAVAVALGAYLRLHPRARVISLALIPFFATIVDVPALLLIALWFPLQLWFGLAALANPEHAGWAIAFAANAGAFLLGAVAIRPFVGALRAPVPGASA